MYATTVFLNARLLMMSVLVDVSHFVKFTVQTTRNTFQPTKR